MVLLKETVADRQCGSSPGGHPLVQLLTGACKGPTTEDQGLPVASRGR